MLSEAGCQELPPPIASSRTTQLPHIPTHETVSSLSLNLSFSFVFLFDFVFSLFKSLFAVFFALVSYLREAIH